ncbi:DUF1473 family protein [Candidatus Borreliella tachyglossi]|uniref:DUF1473 family protein n=1 Tax=Candidatus Borreliella tachyglossi TaxID=1964448 RepID=UPI0040420027
MRYKMKILTEIYTYEYIVKVIPLYEWDKILTANQIDGNNRLYDLDYLKKITNLMINPRFIDDFCSILNNNRRYTREYKRYLIAILYSIQFDRFDKDSDFKKPHLVYLEEFENNVGDFEKFDYITEDWNYDTITAKLDALIKQ